MSRLRRLALVGLVINVIAIVLLTTYPFDFDPEASAVAKRWNAIYWVVFYRNIETGKLIVDRDLIQNILFFVPLGFCFTVSRGQTLWRSLLGATLLGLFLSTTVEGLQLLLPTRVTQPADVWRNTLGSLFGGWLATQVGTLGDN